MMKFICPSCNTENIINEGATTCMCAGCSLLHRFMPERNTSIDISSFREHFEHSFMQGDFSTALDWADKYDSAAGTIPSHYIKECVSALVNALQPSDALVEQFIMLGFEGHKRMMAWKVIDNWLKTQFTNKYYSQWLLALSNFHFKHKAVLNEDEYTSTTEKSELKRVLTPNETLGITTGVTLEKNSEQSEDTSAKSDIIDNAFLNVSESVTQTQAMGITSQVNICENLPAQVPAENILAISAIEPVAMPMSSLLSDTETEFLQNSPLKNPSSQPEGLISYNIPYTGNEDPNYDRIHDFFVSKPKKIFDTRHSWCCNYSPCSYNSWYTYVLEMIIYVLCLHELWQI